LRLRTCRRRRFRPERLPHRPDPRHHSARSGRSDRRHGARARQGVRTAQWAGLCGREPRRRQHDHRCQCLQGGGARRWLLSRSSVSIYPALYKNLSYDPIKDFDPITNLAFAHQVLILNKNVPVKDFKELVAYSKQHPDKLNFGSFGVGGDTHLVVEWLKHETGAQMTHIPFKGASDAMLAFKSGDIQLIYLIIGNPDIARQVNEGEVKGLLVPGSKRNPLVPAVPSFGESGLSPDQSAFETWFGMFAPKGTLADIVKKLNAEFSAIVKSPEFANQYLISKGFEPVGDASEAFVKFIVEDQKKGKLLVDISGAKLEQ
jgi:tripartite-type tricarboxylate transporter receptor subunit TctC